MWWLDILSSRLLRCNWTAHFGFPRKEWWTEGRKSKTKRCRIWLLLLFLCIFCIFYMEIIPRIQYRNFCSLLLHWVPVAILYNKEYNSSHCHHLTLPTEKLKNFMYVIFNSQTYFNCLIWVSCSKLLAFLLDLFSLQSVFIYFILLALKHSRSPQSCSRLISKYLLRSGRSQESFSVFYCSLE